MLQTALDAGWLFGKEEHSDARVVVVEEGGSGDDATAARSEQGDGDNAAASGERGGEPAPKRARMSSAAAGSSAGGVDASAAAEGLVLPIHKAIVMSASAFFKARIDKWHEGSSEPCRVVLHVPAGQLELGRRLVRAMYEAAPGLGDLSAEQQLQLLRLADRYGAPHVVKAAAAAAGIDVAVMADEGLAWAAVQAAYPRRGSPTSAPALQQFAADALQQLFGDLEAVYTAPVGDEKRIQLLELPHAALKALLADERTRVASENTVWHTIEDWVDVNQWAVGDGRFKELLALVRVARLTPHYARTVFCESRYVRDIAGPSDLAAAAMLPLAGDGASLSLRRFDADTWRLPARPRSAQADALELEWAPRLSELEALVGSLPAAGEGCKIESSPTDSIWQGWPLQLQVRCTRVAGGAVTLGLCLKALPPRDTAGALITGVFEAAAAEGIGGIRSTCGPCLYVMGASSWGDHDFFGLGRTGEGADGGGGAGPPRDWADVEAALRAARLVHGDGAEAHLKLRCTVTQLQ